MRVGDRVAAVGTALAGPGSVEADEGETGGGCAVEETLKAGMSAALMSALTFGHRHS